MDALTFDRALAAVRISPSSGKAWREFHHACTAYVRRFARGSEVADIVESAIQECYRAIADPQLEDQEVGRLVRQALNRTRKRQQRDGTRYLILDGTSMEQLLGDLLPRSELETEQVRSMREEERVHAVRLLCRTVRHLVESGGPLTPQQWELVIPPAAMTGARSDQVPRSVPAKSAAVRQSAARARKLFREAVRQEVERQHRGSANPTRRAMYGNLLGLFTR